MEETLKVKIVAETSQATSSLKQLNKESNNLGSNTNAASAAVDKLDKALNSIGFKSIKIKAISDGFKEIRASGAGVKDQIQKISSAFDRLREFKLHSNAFGGLGDKLRMSHIYMSQLEKKAPEAAKKIQDVFTSINEAKNATRDSDAVLNISGLSKVKQSIEDLATSRNKAIKNTLNEEDFQGLKDNLLKASIAGAKGARKEYIDALNGINTVLGKSLEKNTLTFQLDTFFIKGKLAIQGLGNLAKATISKIGSLLSKLGKGLLVGGVLGAITGAIALVKNAFNVSELGDSIDKTSQKVGMSTDKFQKWAYVLERCGIETSQLKSSMRALTRNSMGNNASYFKQLGIDPSKMSQEQLFESTVKALQNISDSTERARLAYKLFGQSSAELAPLLAISSAEVQRLSYQYDLLGATMSGKVVRASADLQDAITDMKSAFQGLKNTLAQAILPLVTKIVVRITVLIAKINMILQALFGVEYEYNDVAESTETVTKNTNETVKAVKKLKTLISGFDELNIFPSQDNGADIGGMLDDLADYGSDVAPVIGNILPPEAIAELENFRDNILPGIVEKINKLKDAWEKIKESFSEGNFGEIFKILGEQFDSPFLTGLGDAVQWVIDRIKELEHWLGDVDLFGWEMPSSLQEFLGFTEDWHIDWDNFLGLEFDFGNSPIGRLLKSLKESFSEAWDGWGFDWENAPLKKLFDKLGESFSEAWDGWGFDWENAPLKKMFDKIGEWDIWKASWWSEKWSNVTKPIKDTWDGIKQWWNQNVSPKFTATFWQNKFQSIKTGINNIPFVQSVKEKWSGVKTWWDTNVAPKFTATYWQNKFSTIKSGLTSSPFLQNVKEKWTGIKTWWDTSVAPKFTLTYWKEKFNMIPNGMGYASIQTAIQEKWNSIKSWWSTNVAPKFTWTYWRDKFNSIKTGLSNVSLVQAGKNIINGLINTIETGINRMIDKINGSGIISALKKIGVDITLNRIYIPRLAQGGVIDKPTMAQLGEYSGAKSNPEIAAPQSIIKETVIDANNELVDVFVQCTRQIISAITDNQVEINLDGRTLLKSVSNANNQYRLQTGQSML